MHLSKYIIPLISISCFCITGCAISNTNTDRPIIKFYEQALKRAKSPNANLPVDIDGLVISDGCPPGCTRYPTIDESSIIVSDPDPKEHQAVQIIVSPRVSGSFLDPANPSPEFLKEMDEARIEALKNHRYQEVYLLPRQ